MTLITIKTFENAVDAHILRTKLESEGIECFIFDENTVSLNPLYNVAVGGVKLKIDEKDLDKARKIYEEINHKPFTDENDEIITCPKCHSSNLYSGFRSFKNPGGFFAMLLTIFFSIFPIYAKKVYRCKDCGCEFERK